MTFNRYQAAVRLVEAAGRLDARQRDADAAFRRYITKRANGEPTNGAGWQRIENEVSDLSRDLYGAENDAWALWPDAADIERVCRDFLAAG